MITDCFSALCRLPKRFLRKYFDSHRRPRCQFPRIQSKAAARGQVLLIVALTMPVLLGMVGFAVDMGRLYVAKARLQASVDAAALAGSLQLFNDPDLNNGHVANAVAEYLSRNYPEATVIDIFHGPEARSVGVKAKVEVPMTFMTVMGIKSRIVDASASAGFNDLEIALVVDNSGSMQGEPINAVKEAANSLVDLMLPNEGAPAIKVGVVPFRGKVRVGGGVDGQPAGCRNADGTVNNSNVDPPDLSCSDQALPPIFPLSYSKSGIKAAINRMQATGGAEYASGTIIAEGIKWGRHVLTSDPPYTEGGAKGRVRKVIILLTDGANEDGTCGGDAGGGDLDPRTNPKSAYRRNAYFQQTPPVTTCGCNDFGCLDQAMLDEAKKTREDGIEIFTIRYGDSSPVDIQLMKSVATSEGSSDNHYFDAPSTRDLHKIFQAIGRQLGFRLL